MTWGLHPSTGDFLTIDDEIDDNDDSVDGQGYLYDIRRMLCNRIQSKRVKSDVYSTVYHEIVKLQRAADEELRFIKHSHLSKHQLSKRILFLFQKDLLPGIRQVCLSSVNVYFLI